MPLDGASHNTIHHKSGYQGMDCNVRMAKLHILQISNSSISVYLNFTVNIVYFKLLLLLWSKVIFTNPRENTKKVRNQWKPTE